MFSLEDGACDLMMTSRDHVTGTVRGRLVRHLTSPHVTSRHLTSPHVTSVTSRHLCHVRHAHTCRSRVHVRLCVSAHSAPGPARAVRHTPLVVSFRPSADLSRSSHLLRGSGFRPSHLSQRLGASPASRRACPSAYLGRLDGVSACLSVSRRQLTVRHGSRCLSHLS